ncbi:unnamed protein product, partial [Mycena citricolor]
QRSTPPQRSRPASKAKPRRAQNACDSCRRRKSDSELRPGARCTYCTQHDLDCTHKDYVKALSSSNGYVEALENRAEKMEKLLQKLLPGINFAEHMEKNIDVSPLNLLNEEALPRNDDTHDLTGTLQKLTMHPERHRHFGKSSSIQLLQTALDFTTGRTGMIKPGVQVSLLPHKRNEFWTPAPWSQPTEQANPPPEYAYPDADLLVSLVDLFFEHVNPYWPLLHEPTFREHLAAGLHRHNHKWGATLMLVCSLGARHSHDCRVNLEGGTDFQSAGWRWHCQVHVITKHLVFKPDLYELQAIVLSSLFLFVITPSAGTWTQIGFGIRRALDVGAHRRSSQAGPTAENESWKRVFWMLSCIEWLSGTVTGRPISLLSADFDQELPIECDDEYWAAPGPDQFKQPENEPSRMRYFSHLIKLMDIQATVTTTIYAARAPKKLYGLPLPSSDAKVLATFDSYLNGWMSTVPEHLKWDPDRPNPVHFRQSALLYTMFYSVQICAHRPFIPGPSKPPDANALPSASICSNAARSCLRVITAMDRRKIPFHLHFMPVLFTCGIVLMLNSWRYKATGMESNAARDLEAARACLALMWISEDRFLVAGRLADMLNRLIHAGEMIHASPNRAVPQQDHQRADPATIAEWARFFTDDGV